MVNVTTIAESNARFTDENHESLICVFVGATAGIGLATLERLTRMIRSSTIYVLGRKPERYADRLRKIRESAPTNEIIFIETQASLLSSIDAASKQIRSAEQKVDLMCMSTGGMPFQGAIFTNEGLETCFAISYYARLRLVWNLRGLLNRSENPRVLSILNGTKEKRLFENDIGLERHWGMMAVVNHTTVLTSLAFDYLAEPDRRITFIHCTPGFVNTGTERTLRPLMKDGIIWWAFVSLMQIVSGWMIRLTGMSIREAGERQAFYLTSDKYQPGSWRSNRLNEIVPDNAIMEQYKSDDWAGRIWEYTLRTWEKASATDAAP